MWPKGTRDEAREGGGLIGDGMCIKGGINTCKWACRMQGSVCSLTYGDLQNDKTSMCRKPQTHSFIRDRINWTDLQ